MKPIASLRAAILGHYDKHKRDLPWRRTRDPYAIWVSEIMLQQTQVDVVTPRWTTFLGRFPDLRSLAAATEATVCEAWAGLGYYRRARFLHRAAQVLVAEHDAVFPQEAAELRKLPGIGRYTAGAIASIAFGQEAPIVDGNVARVLSRVFAIEDAPDSPAGQRRIWDLAGELVVGERPGDLNQGLMEMGATVCTPRNPKCLPCPIRTACQAAARGQHHLFPRPMRATKVEAMTMAFGVFADEKGTYLVQRPLDGLWAGLWEPPVGTRLTRIQRSI
jgi:A/G-specific adenine glycosylase